MVVEVVYACYSIREDTTSVHDHACIWRTITHTHVIYVRSVCTESPLLTLVKWLIESVIDRRPMLWIRLGDAELACSDDVAIG